MEIDRPGESTHSRSDTSLLDRPMDRRGFLKAGVAGGLWLGTAGLGLLGCADEGLNPENLLLIWVAQSITGRITTGAAAQPVAGAQVVFRASLDPEFLLDLAQGTTDQNGHYSFSAARNGAPDAFWVLRPEENRRYSVFIQIEAGKSGVGGVSTQRSFFRFPSREAPTGNLLPYQLTQNAVIIPQ